MAELVPDKGRSFGKDVERIMQWNADVERRRREYHERRCAEDPVYRRAYERRQEMMQRVQLMNSRAMAQLTDAMNGDADSKCRQATDQTNVGGDEQRVKTHEEAMRERAVLRHSVDQNMKDGYRRIGDLSLFDAGLLALLFADKETEQRLKDLVEETPYVEEIRKADREFDSEIIRMGGFEW